MIKAKISGIPSMLKFPIFPIGGEIKVTDCCLNLCKIVIIIFLNESMLG